jgi:glycosyltransferase involved in cell wall biosynthesis
METDTITMRTSFIIPAYNEENYIGGCLDAILRATRTVGYRDGDYEIIVVDNHSTDDTDAIVTRHPGVILIHEARRGANRARETGFESSHGDFVAFLDADTMISAEWLERAEKEFAHNRGLVCVSGPFIFYDLPLAVRILIKIFDGISYVVYFINSSLLHKTSVIMGGAAMIRHDALQKIGGHNVNLKFYGDDADLAMRLNKIGKVKFSSRFSVQSSGRRLAKEGAFTMGLRYGLNYFWVTLLGKPFTTTAKEIRLEDQDDSIYHPENHTREWVIATFVFFLFLALLLGVAQLVVLIVRLKIW